jgi:hypothetical protein
MTFSESIGLQDAKKDRIAIGNKNNFEFMKLIVVV